MEIVTDFIFLGSKISADGDCSHEIKRHLLLGRKVMTNLDSILKSRDITLLTKVHLVKAMFFPVVMHECESWTIKKAEHRRIDAFELWYDGSDGKASACNLSQHQGFPVIQFFTSGGQSIGISASVSVLPMNIQD